MGLENHPHQNNKIMTQEEIIELIDARINHFSGGEEMKSLRESMSDSRVVNELQFLKEAIKE